MCPSAPRVCSEPGGQRLVLSLSLDLIDPVQWYNLILGLYSLSSKMSPSQYKDCLSQVWEFPYQRLKQLGDRLILNMGIPIPVRQHFYIETAPKSQVISKLWVISVELSDYTEILQVPRQQCCQGTCQISKSYDHNNTHFLSFETWQDLVVIRFPLSD